MEINKNLSEDKMIIALVGRLDTTTAPQLEEAFNGVLDQAKNVELDLKEMDYISSAGLRVILMIQKKVNAAKGGLEVKNVCDTVMEIFDMTGFSDVLTIC
ncbi:MAG: anti-sigma factor antagonist [Eubacteriaceae bacterium]|jgi:anti-sigma B factor antagonist|nr:anti-sigma factor antagonist [Eubacteriaceae bacterium]